MPVNVKSARRDQNKNMRRSSWKSGRAKIKTKTSAGQNLSFLDKIQIIIDYLRHIFIVETSYQNWIDDQTKEIHA